MKNKELKLSNCDENVGCQIQYTTEMLAEDTVIACKVWNSAGDATRYIHINVKGKSTRGVVIFYYDFIGLLFLQLLLVE
jgi:hypothetical protein